MTDTNGNGIMNQLFAGYEPWKGDIVMRERGSIVVHEAGETTGYGLFNTQDRGRLFVGPGVPVYEGMIVGECSKMKISCATSAAKADDQYACGRIGRCAALGSAHGSESGAVYGVHRGR